MANFGIGVLLVFHFIVGIFLVIIVLMQRTKEGGMGAAFGAGVTDSLFGASSGNVLTKITVWTAAIFFTTSLAMAVIFSHRSGTAIGAGTLGQSPQTPPAITEPSGTLTPGGTATPQGTTTAPQGTLTPPPDAPKPPNDGDNQAPPQGDAPKQPAPASGPPPENALPPPQPPQGGTATPQLEQPKVNP